MSTSTTAESIQWGLPRDRVRAARAHMKRNPVQRLGLAVACGVAGYALNRWRMGSPAPLLLGRVVTLPIAILLGPWYGAAAAVVAALPASGPFSIGLVLL